MKIDNDVHIKIEKITGDSSEYDAWSITAYAWIEDSGEKKYERRVTSNFLKDDRNLEKIDGSNPQFVERLKEDYKEILKEDEVYSDYSIESLEDEKYKMPEFVGDTFVVSDSSLSSQSATPEEVGEPVAVMSGQGRSEKPIKQDLVKDQA